MKKFLSLILALAMVACMSVTAFAADPTTTLTVEVPDNTPSYTFHCPSEVTLEYGNTNKQKVGDVFVTDISSSIDNVHGTIPYSNLINTTDSDDQIELNLYSSNEIYWDDEYALVQKDGSVIENGMSFVHNYYESPNKQYTYSLFAQVSDWSGATAGATYQATITYVVETVRYV